MKKILMIVLILFCFHIGKSDNEPKEITTTKNTISGIVIDMKTNEPLTGVEINISGIDKKIYTDLDGYFLLEDLKDTTYSVIFTMISYNSCLIDIKLDNNKNANVKMINR